MTIESFLEYYPSEVAGLLLLARQYLMQHLPELQEELDLPSKILIYRLSPGMKGIVFTLIPSKKGLKIGFYRGRDMEDPAGLMEGHGKVHSTIPLNEDILNRAEFQALINQAAARARLRIITER